MTVYDPIAKDSTVTRTVRINEAYDEVLRYEADRHGVSVNTLVDRVIRKYSVSYRFFENFGASRSPLKRSRSCCRPSMRGR